MTTIEIDCILIDKSFDCKNYGRSNYPNAQSDFKVVKRSAKAMFLRFMKSLLTNMELVNDLDDFSLKSRSGKV